MTDWAGEDTIARTSADVASPRGPNLARGSCIGRYVVLGDLGAGGMGVVYTAYDPELDRKIALKLLHADRVTATGHDRLLREAQAIAKLSHPNVVAVYDVGESDGRVFITMEFVEGTTLGRWVGETTRTHRQILDVFAAAARGLMAAHAAGLVHRDVKPDNVLVGSDDRVRVMDFGLARPAGKTIIPALDDTQARPQHDALGTDLTQSGTILGTPAYMAPEQHLARSSDEKTDQFSFCVALYEALYGERPFAGDTLAALAFNVTQGKVSPPPASSVPLRLRRVLLRGLSVDPADRWPTMHELIVALERDPSLRWRRWLPWGGMMLVGSASVVGAQQYVAFRTGLCRGAAERLARDWSTPQKVAIRRSLAAAGVGSMVEGRPLIEQELDHYANAWVEHHVEACEAHRRGEESANLLDRRMACLGERWAQFQAVVNMLGQADRTIARRAPAMIGNLPPLSRCSDTRRLAATVRPPDNARIARVVDELREQLARARALEDAGRYDEGLDASRHALARALQLRYAPIEASARLRLGSLADREGNLDSAQSELRHAYLLALGAGADDIAAEAATNLAYFVGVQLSNHAEGLHWAEHARAVIERGGGEELAIADLLNQRGLVFDASADSEAAQADFEAALEMFTALLGADHFRTAAVHNNLAMAAFKVGQYDRAAQGYRLAIEIHDRRFGAGHPVTAQMLANLAMTASRMGGHDEACELFERAIASTERWLTDEHDLVSSLRYNYAEALRAAGKHTAACEQYELAIRLIRAKHGDHHERVGLAYRGVAEALMGAGRYDEAATRLENSLRILEPVEGPRHPSTAAALTSLGQVRIKLDRPSDAVPPLQRALAVREWTAAPPEDLAETQFALASALWAAGSDRAAAVILAQRAERGYARAGSTWHAQRQEVKGWLLSHER